MLFKQDARPILNQKSFQNFRHCITLFFFIFSTFLYSRASTVFAQAADIGIILPQSDVSYARSVSKRLTRLLNSIGLAADTYEEASISEQHLKRLVVLPLNTEVSTKTANLLTDFVGRGGKLLVTYGLADEVADLLALRKTGWLKEEEAGQFAAVHLNAPEISGIPSSVRQASWNITLAEPTAPQTKIIGYWHTESGESTGYPALFVGGGGAFFSHIFLSDDIETKKRLLAALLGHLVPEFRRAIAEHAVDNVTTIGHTKDSEALRQFVVLHGVPEAREALKIGQDLVQHARDAYARSEYETAISTIRAGRDVLSRAYSLSQTSVATEGRAVWNHSGLGAYPGDWERSAQELAAAGVNMILPNMAWGGIAHYRSEFLPPSEKFAQYGDQIEQCVKAAHRHGLEVHIWKITWNLEGAPTEFQEKMRKTGRTQVSAKGEQLNWLCPSQPENVQLELSSLLEIVKNYDIDGIHLDYIRYPGSHACYCQQCRKRFIVATKKQVNEWPAAVLPGTGKYGAEYTTWRTEQITRLVRMLHKRARAVKHDIKISAAVFGGYPACVSSIGQDWVAWAKAGYLDFVCPMNYTEEMSYFTELLENQLALLPQGVAIYPGIGATASNSILTADSVVGQIYLARYLGAAGWTIFDYSADISHSVLPAIAMGLGTRKAVPPH